MKQITYITRDIERALGMNPSAEYHIVCNKSPYSETIKATFPEFVTLIPAPAKPMGTGDLIAEYSKTTKPATNSSLLVFKNTERIEPVAVTAGWSLLNPKASLAESIENKISQIEWLGDLSKYLASHHIDLAKNITWSKEPFILQWAHGHTGGGTVLISSEKELDAIKAKFPERITRRTEFVGGPSFTVNVVVAPNKILIGNVSYQITGTLPFTDNVFATVGNDWALTHSLLNEREIEYIHEIARNIGKKMSDSGWRGLFGIDLIRDDERNTMHLIEINARQPASTTFESFLQRENRALGVKGITMFEAHIKALQDEKIDDELILINDGAQILQRITSQIKDVSNEKIVELNAQGHISIPYLNIMPNEDLLRIQSMQGLMETHGRLNKRGKAILEIITGVKKGEEIDTLKDAFDL